MRAAGVAVVAGVHFESPIIAWRRTVSERAPFLSFDSFSVAAVHEAPPAARTNLPSRSPFLSVYELEDGEDPQAQALRETYATLMHELDDEEFDEALFELQCRGRAMHDAQLALGRPRAEADRLVTQHFSRLMQASESMVDTMAREFAPRERGGIVEQEIDTYVQSYAPPANLDPEFEEFFGKLVKKIGGAVKTVAKKAIKGVAQLALGPALNLIKGAVKPILKRVLEWAIGKLPVALQPVAQRLAQKLGFAKPVPQAAPQMPGTDAAASTGDPAMAAASGDVDAALQAAAGDDAATAQEELNGHIAAALLAEDEVELELEAAQFSSPAAMLAPATFAELDDARERLISELAALGDNESAEPHIQNFLPAILPALRIGLRIVGRQRVVNFLGGLLAGLVGKLVGPQNSQALGRAIADAGLKLMSLEMSEAESERLAPAAVAATLEETIGRAAAFPDEVLDDPELLEGYTLEAFEHAAAANLPAIFSESTYRRRPDLLEAGVNAGWILLPLRGPKRYKRCTRTFNVRVSPHLAEEVQSFEGAALADHIQDQLGVEEGEHVDAQVHLYEALPGSTLADIARGEREVLGGGLSDEANLVQLHPLTPQASAALLGKAGLGRAMPMHAHGRRLWGGQRFYHLGTGRRPLLVPGHQRRGRVRRLLNVNLTVDGVQDQARLCVFISEVKAQKLAANLRQSANLGQLTATFQRTIGRRIASIFRGQAPRRLKIVHGGLRPGNSPARALRNLPPAAAQAFVGKLQGWLTQGFAEFVKAQSQRIIAATEDAADGITLVFTVEHPPGLKALGQALTEQGTSGSAIAEAVSAGTAPAVRVEVHAGRRCG
jgi:hypothetical protein